MILLVGLGNPGPKYQKTRHNVGFQILDEFVKSHQGLWKKEANLQAQVAKVQLNNQKLICLKPETFMNQSGQSVKLAKEYFNIPLSQIWVIHDDKDIPLGMQKISQTSGAGEHNGVKSIAKSLHSLEFPRFRIGLGWNTRQISQMKLEDWVLQEPTKSEQETLKQALNRCQDALEIALAKDIDTAAQKVHSLT